MKDYVYFLLFELLKRESYRINPVELKFQLLSHPSYPSLHSITGVLNHFKIENSALKLPCNLDILNELPENFIAVSKEKQFLLVKKSKDIVNLTFEDGTTKKQTFESFLEIWDGIVVGVEPSDTGKGSRLDNLISIRKLLPLTVVLLLVGHFFFSGPNNFMIAHFLLGLLGLLISLSIVNHELGYHSKVLEGICNSGKTTNCDEVLNSKGANFFGLKLSDLSLIYFLGITMGWSLLILLEADYFLLKMITLAAIAAPVFSIYYQYFIVKKWCPLCLGVAGVLLLQASTLVLSGPSVFQIDQVAALAFGFLVSAVVWIPGRSLLQENKELRQTQIDHSKFKRNINVFLALSSRATKKETFVSQIHDTEITLGNKNSSVELLLLTSPLCFYCKSAHNDIAKIIERYSSMVRIVIRFNINAENLESIGVKVSSRLLEIYNNEDEEVLNLALEEAFAENVNLEAWLEKWGDCSNSEVYHQVLREQQNWCRNNNMYFTPALLLNGRMLPEEYSREDLLFFMDDIVELATTNADGEIDFVQVG